MFDFSPAFSAAGIFFIVISAVALLVFLLLYGGSRHNVSACLTEGERPAFDYNGRLFKKCFFGTAIVWIVCLIAALVCALRPSLFVWYDELYSSPDKGEFRRFVQTVELDDYEIDMKGEYYFELSTDMLDFSVDRDGKAIELPDGFFIYSCSYYEEEDGLRRYPTGLYYESGGNGETVAIVDDLYYSEEAEAFLLRYGNHSLSVLAVRAEDGRYSVGTETDVGKGVRFGVLLLQAISAPVAVIVYFGKRRKK